VERSETRYTRSGDVSIAYQVVGDGPFDLVYVPGWVSSIELMWDEPDYAAFLERLASFSRLIIFDKRGTGLSDPVPLDQLAHARGADGRRPGSHGRRRLGACGAARARRAATCASCRGRAPDLGERWRC
jgi:pimeloyl-ACP methyl ester carboxylesterase